MPQVIQYTKTLYQFAELDDRAKEAARDWFRQRIDADDYSETGHIEEIAAHLGIIFDCHDVPLMSGKTRQEPAILWSGFSCQGDGACFEGSYSYRKGAARLIREHTPTDEKLQSIADRLQAVQHKHFYGLTATVEHEGRYRHEYCTKINVTNLRTGDDAPRQAQEEVAECLRDFMRWTYRRLEAQYNYCMSAEYCDESIEANEYTFTENGKRAD